MKKIITLLVLVVFLSGYSGKISANEAESLYRSAKAIIGATSVGVNYQKFGELLQGLATEISIVKDKKLRENEQELLKLYEEAMRCYEDSMILWRAMIKYDVDNPGRMDYADMKMLLALQPMLARYGLELKIDERASKFMNFTFYILPKNSLQFIWGEAHKKIEQADKILYPK